MRGKFIVFEGLDHCGKSTQAKLLKEFFSSSNEKSVLMNFPSFFFLNSDRETTIGKMINEFLTLKSTLSDEAIHLLFSANRWEKNSEIKSLLESGTTIVCDRFAFSGVAFTSAKVNFLSKGYDIEWCKNADRGLVKPDAVIYLDLSVSEISKRKGFGEEVYERQDFQQKVKGKFDEMSGNWLRIDATKPIEEISKEINEFVSHLTINPKLESLWTSAE